MTRQVPSTATCRLSRSRSGRALAQRDDHRRVSKRLAVQEHGHHVLTGQVPLLERPQLRRAGLDEAPGYRGTREPNRPGNRRGGGRVVAAGNPVQHPPQQQVVHVTIATHGLIGPQRDLAPRHTANPGHPNRHALPRETHRPRVTAVTATTDRRVLPGVARARQRRHLLVEQLLYVHQAQRNQRTDQLHLGVQLQIRVGLAANDRDSVVFLRGFPESAPSRSRGRSVGARIARTLWRIHTKSFTK